MDELERFEQTPERMEILDTLERAVRLLHERAEKHRAVRSEERTHLAFNRAQQVAGVIDLLHLDWHEDDIAAKENAA